MVTNEPRVSDEDRAAAVAVVASKLPKRGTVGMYVDLSIVKALVSHDWGPTTQLREIAENAKWVTHDIGCDDEDCPGQVRYATGDEAMERAIFLDEWQRAQAVAEDLGKELDRLRPAAPTGPREGDPF